MDEVETEFLQSQRFKALVWLKYIDSIFFMWIYNKENLYLFREDLNNFKSNLKIIFKVIETLLTSLTSMQSLITMN